MSSKQKTRLAAEAKRVKVGRPVKPARKGRKYQIGVIVTGDVKATVAKRAKQSGRTISREVEIMIERLLQYERAHGTPAGAVRDLLWRYGYRRLGISNPRTGVRGFAWAEPGVIEESGFVPMEEGELEAMQEQARILEEAQRKKPPSPEQEEQPK